VVKMNLSYRNEHNARFIAALYNKPLDKPDWYKIENVSDDETQVLLYDYIGWPFNSAEEFVKMLAEIKQPKVTIRINSLGGDVWDANAIFNAIKAHPSKPITRIESLAASAASYIAVAGYKKQAYKNTMLMIHEPMTGLYGNQYEFREVADILEQISGNMIDMYADNTNIGKREIKDMLKVETWMTAKAAKEKGFVDEIIEAGKPVKAEFDLSIFATLPDELMEEEKGKVFTGFDVERILHDAKAPKGFAKAVAAACRAAGLFDRRQADNDHKDESEGATDQEAAKNREMFDEVAAQIRSGFEILNCN